MFAIPALLQMLPSLAGVVASSFIDDKKTLMFVDLAVGIINAGVQVESKLSALNAEIQAFVDAGVAPPDTWWVEYRARSDAAHEDIQRAARD